jgi:hypothetical protein
VRQGDPLSPLLFNFIGKPFWNALGSGTHPKSCASSDSCGHFSP